MWDANKARGKAECFTGIEAEHWVLLFYVQQELDHALIVLKNLLINT